MCGVLHHSQFHVVRWGGGRAYCIFTCPWKLRNRIPSPAKPLAGCVCLVFDMWIACHPASSLWETRTVSREIFMEQTARELGRRWRLIELSMSETLRAVQQRMKTWRSIYLQTITNKTLGIRDSWRDNAFKWQRISNIILQLAYIRNQHS